MRLKKTNLTIGMLFSILITFSSCNSHGTINDSQTPLKQESKSGEKMELDLKATLIYQDKKDNLWFASKEKGVYRYDGENLFLFTSNDGLDSYRIISVQEDNLGNLYFDTPESVYKYDGDKFTTLSVMESKESEYEWKSEPGDLWFRIGWDKKGPYRFDGDNLYYLEFPKSKIEDEFHAKYPNISYNPYSIYSIYTDSNGNIWFGTADLGIYQFDGTQVRWMHEEHLGTSPEGGAFGIRSIIEDKDGYFWICNTNYKYKILPDSKDDDMQLKSLNYKKEKGVINENDEVLYFMSMLLDDKGNLWMVNMDGIWKNNGQELVPFFIKDGERNISPTSIYKDNQGTLWFGTDQHGIYKYNGITFEKFRIK